MIDDSMSSLESDSPTYGFMCSFMCDDIEKVLSFFSLLHDAKEITPEVEGLSERFWGDLQITFGSRTNLAHKLIVRVITIEPIFCRIADSTVMLGRLFRRRLEQVMILSQVRHARRLATI